MAQPVQPIQPAQPAPGSGILIGRVFGIPIYLHISWFIVFFLITFSLGKLFESQHPGWTPQQRWGSASSRACFSSLPWCFTS